MKYIIILILLISFSTKANNKKNETKEVSSSQIFCQEKQASILLKKLNLLNSKLIVDLPNDFELMSKEMLATKYPASNRPTLVYTNENGSINFAFNHTLNNIPKGKLPEILPVFVKQFNSLYPQIQWFKKDVEKVNGKEFVILEFTTPAID